LLNKKAKGLIVLVIVLVGIYFTYGLYMSDQNQSLKINGYTLWLSFDRNITQVDNLDMAMNYNDKTFQFSSHFVPKGQNIVFEIETLRFNQDNSCNMVLQELDSDSNPKQVWPITKSLIQRISMKNDPHNSTLLLKGTCTLNDTAPNGFLQIELSNQTKPVPISNATLDVHFDASKFGCRENCLYNIHSHVLDDDKNNGVYHISAIGNNIDDARNLVFELRTFDQIKANHDEIWLALFIGLIIFAFHVIYDLYKDLSISKV